MSDKKVEMRYLFLGLLMVSQMVYAQNNSVVYKIFFRPEVTMYPEFEKGDETGPQQHTLNFGAGGAIEYKLHQKWLFSAGVGFVSRVFNIQSFFCQSCIPPPRQSFTQELVHTDKVVHRVLEFPLEAGYELNISPKSSLLFKAGYVFTYLWNANYHNNTSRYDGTYEKREWIMGAPTGNLGYEYSIGNKWRMSATISYAIKSMEYKDPYLYWQGKPTPINYRFASISLGVAHPIN